MGTAKLELKGLSKSYGDVQAVSLVDLTIQDGELVVLLGPSGCGKTTILRMIAGFTEPTAGSIVVDGRIVSEPGYVTPPERRDMAMIFQSYALWPHMTVSENVAYGLRLGKEKLDRRKAKERADVALASVHMDAFGDRYPAELSGGQQQRVSLARSLVLNPAILLFDEPLSNLDAQLRDTMRAEIRRLHEEFQFTAVYVTHDQAEAMTLGARVAVMRQGNVEQVDEPRTLCRSPRTAFVAEFLGGRVTLAMGRIVGNGLVEVGDVALPCRAEGFKPGQEVTVVMPPSSWRVKDPAGPETMASFTALVDDVLFIGSAQECRLDVPTLGISLWISIDPHVEIQKGNDVEIALVDTLAVVSN